MAARSIIVVIVFFWCVYVCLGNIPCIYFVNVFDIELDYHKTDIAKWVFYIFVARLSSLQVT